MQLYEIQKGILDSHYHISFPLTNKQDELQIQIDILQGYIEGRRQLRDDAEKVMHDLYSWQRELLQQQKREKDEGLQSDNPGGYVRQLAGTIEDDE
jgi:hypothetical protein